MKRLIGLLFAMGLSTPVCAQITHFQHIVIIVQENRSPDNLFYALCATEPCSTNPNATQYNIQTTNWLDKKARKGVVQPKPVPLANDFDPQHTHVAFTSMCDLNTQTGACRMDGAADIICKKNCPPGAEFRYVDNSTGTIAPYLFLATQYGWANYMFQTNQGPSFPAHQFLFGATSAPSGSDDHKGTFMAENLGEGGKLGALHNNGCIALPKNRIQLINAKGIENPNNKIFPCAEHATVGDALQKQTITWRYYTPGAGDLWSAPDAIKHICQPAHGHCTGPIWQQNVALNPVDVFGDLAACNLRNVSWVIPSAQYSDHASSNTGGGPAWVAGIINAIGNSSCTNTDGTSYWDSTVIIVTWDDWGGWYDHVPPKFLAYPEGGYQYGFRVPLVFVSAYTPPGYINNELEDFGSVIRFMEFNFGIPMGELTFADARATRNLAHFYDLTTSPRAFQNVPGATLSVGDFAKMKLAPPDDD